jgi:transcription initiation factor TFIIIB Brf1 subunit/transcription initiation factor TFIIB
MLTTYKANANARRLAVMVRDLLDGRRPFETVADLTDALKARCSRLHIPWTNDEIAEAYRLIESNRRLVTRRPSC